MTDLGYAHRPAGAGAALASRGVNRADALALLRLAAPVTGLALVNMAMSVTDTLMTAAFGPEALAAVAVGSDFYSILFYLAVGCIGGLGPLYAAAHAAGDSRRLARLRSAGWVVTMLLALPLGTAIWSAPAILHLLGIGPTLIEQGAGYTRAMALTFVPMLAVCVLRTRLTAIERPGVMLRITLVMVPLNALLNHLFMHGAAGLPGLGVTGAGVSSFVVACGTLAALCVLAGRNDRGGMAWPDRHDLGEVLRIGLPSGVATLAEVGVYLGATIYAATLSVTDVAAHSVAIRMAGLTYAVYVGLQQAAMVRLARSDGAPLRRQQIVSTALVSAWVAGAALCLAIAAAAYPLARHILGASADAGGIAVVLLGLLALSDLVGPGGATASGLLRALKDTRPVMVLSLVGHWAVAAPLAVLLTTGLGMGAIGIWIALTAGSLLTSVTTVLALRRHVPATVRL